MIAALSMPLFLPLLITVNGTMAPFHGPLPQPWKSIYWANPITYYIKGQLANIMHKTTVYCTAKELMHFNPPPGMTCGAYAGDWVAAGKGSLVNPEATSDCGYCQYARGEEFLDTFNAPYHMKWTSWGVLLCFTVGNVCAILGWFLRGCAADSFRFCSCSFVTPGTGRTSRSPSTFPKSRNGFLSASRPFPRPISSCPCLFSHDS